MVVLFLCCMIVLCSLVALYIVHMLFLSDRSDVALCCCVDDLL